MSEIFKQMKKLLIVMLFGMIIISAKAQETEATRLLKEQNKEFAPEIIQVNEQVYTAVGYDGSNTSMIIGDDGVVIVDALRALGAAEKVAAAFRKISSKPVKALIYTHGHADHTGGASAFIGKSENVIVIARQGFKEEVQAHSPVKFILQQRNARQFGRNLPPEDIINRGVAPGSTSTDRVGKGYVEPNYTFEDSLRITLAGLDLELYAADGETNDQLFVWCPGQKTLFTGDNYYKAFPNLYAIRGSQYRDVKAWGQSVQKMSSFPVGYVVPGHTRPLVGKAIVHRNLRNYATAILSVYQQTIDCMNKGYSLQQTVDHVKLPDFLINQANLQEFYGSVAWGVRSIYFHYVGWFDGNPTNLYPLSSKDEALRIIALAGGEKKVMRQLRRAFENRDYQWGLQLADYLSQVDYREVGVTEFRIKILRALALQQKNAPARNYYLSYANELEGELGEKF